MCWLCGTSKHSFESGLNVDVGAISGPTSGAPSLGIDAIVAQLRTSWGGAWENDTYPLLNSTVYYAALTSTPNDSSPENAGFQAMSTLMASRAGEAFELWDDLIAINLTPVSSAPAANANIIQFAYSSSTQGGGTYEYAVSGSYLGTNSYGGDAWGITRAEIWMNTGWSTHSSSSVINQAGYNYYGGYGFITYVHEIGHALGLSHPGTYNAGSGGSITYANNAEYLQDTRRYSVMSYFDADADGSGTDHYGSSGSWRYAQTPMIHDIAAVQAIYGADTTTRTGDTTYGFNSNAGKDVYDFTRNTNPIISIYDAGGSDTLDLSGFGAGQYGGQVINLTPGSYSNVGGYMTNNLAIAYTATIENAIGGSGNDTITGNTVANALTGGAGNDTLYGGDGNDTLDGGLGTDNLHGQSGDDTFLFSGPNNGADTIFDFAGTDKIALKGSAFGLSAGSLAAAGVTFSYGASATAAGASLFLDLSTDRLYYDADGTGAGAAVQLATFQWPSGKPGNLGTVGASFEIQATGDFDRNGISDVLWRDTSNNAVGAWLMDASGVRTWSAMGTVNAAYNVVASGDFDGNGTTDVLWKNNSTGHTGAWLMRDGQPTGWLDLGNLAAGWDVKGIGDFDRNGIDDILWVNSGTNVAGAWLMGNGDPRDWLDLGTLNAGWQTAGVGDFNADGTDDVLFFNTATRQVGAWRVNEGRPSDWWAIATLDAGYSIDQVADLNGDGTADIYFYNATTDSAKAWRMNGGAAGGELDQPSFDGDWQLAGSGQLNGTGGADLLWHNTVTGAVVANSSGFGASSFLVV
jgi:Ca2+-binding RTX toxin-like protein